MEPHEVILMMSAHSCLQQIATQHPLPQSRAQVHGHTVHLPSDALSPADSKVKTSFQAP